MLNNQINTTMATTNERILAMVKDIDGNFERTATKAALQYDKETLKYITTKGFVTGIGGSVTRKYHGTNYSAWS